MNRRKRQRATTVVAALDSLTTEVTKLEQSLDDSTAVLLQKPKNTLITELNTDNTSPRLLRNSLRSHSLDKKQQKRGTFTVRDRDSPEEQLHAKPIGMLHRLPTLPPSRLGPGSYNAHPARTTYNFHFEQAPRFPMTYYEKLASYRPHARALTPDERKEITHRIRENILALKRYTPIERIKTLRERAALQESRGQISRTLKYEIAQAVRKKREEDIEVKQRRFEWRMRAEDISIGKIKWCGLICATGMVARWMKKFYKRRELHIRSEGILKMLLLMAICVGKMSLRVKSRRRIRSYAVLRHLVPYMRRWLVKHRKRLIERLAEYIDNSVSQETIFRMVATWKRRIMSLQRAIKAWFMQRKMHKQLMVKQWDKYENTQQMGKVSKSSGHTIKELKSDSRVPEPVKYALVGDYLRVKVLAFCEKRSQWKRHCQDLVKQRLAILEDDPLLQLPEIKYPPPPRFSSLLNKTELAELVTIADKKKSRWDRIAKDGVVKELKSQPTRGQTLLSIPNS